MTDHEMQIAVERHSAQCRWIVLVSQKSLFATRKKKRKNRKKLAHIHHELNLDQQVLMHLSMYCTVNSHPPTHPTPTLGKYGALAIKQNQTVIMPHIQEPLILSNPPPNVNKFPHPRAKFRLICHMQIKLPTESVCARLAQLVRSLTANQKVLSSIPRLVYG